MTAIALSFAKTMHNHSENQTKSYSVEAWATLQLAMSPSVIVHRGVASETRVV